jgi:hypothetical protein
MCQIVNGMEKGERMYSLKMESGYNESYHEWHSKGIKDIQTEDGEQV